MAAVVAIVSCKKDDVDNCQDCEASNSADFEICEEDGKIFVDGTEIPEAEGLSLERAISILETDSEFEDLSCR